MDTNLHQLDGLLQTMSPITLDEMKSIRLMKRTDKKYLTDPATLRRLIELARNSYYVQEIDGHRICSYATTYWDDAENRAFRMHQTGHLPRYKIRVRTYADSDLSFLEIKTKDNHKRTTKKRIRVPSVQSVIDEHYGESFLQELTSLNFSHIQPKVSNRFHRITLVNHGKTERLTIDFDLHFCNIQTGYETDMPDIAIIELKRDGLVDSPVLQLLRELRIKPLGFSKYCIGAAVTNPDLRINRFKKRLIKINKVAHKPHQASITPSTLQYLCHL